METHPLVETDWHIAGSQACVDRIDIEEATNAGVASVSVCDL